VRSVLSLERKIRYLEKQKLALMERVAYLMRRESKVRTKQSKVNSRVRRIPICVEAGIGIITALPEEFAAVKASLLDCQYYCVAGKGAGRRYIIGRIPSVHGGDHRIALAMCGMGNNVAAARATLVLGHFSTIDSVIMVGIAGGVPFPQKAEQHVRLGDIVVSDKKGVVQYDMIKLSEIRSCQVPTGAKWIESVELLKVEEYCRKRPWDKHIKRLLSCFKQHRPDADTDVLYDSEDPSVRIDHPDDPARWIDAPRVFYGPIGSANELLKDPKKRDRLRDAFGVKAIEMEGSGIADATWYHEKSYIVVRGICDYCDSRKNDVWHKYAAIVAAGFAKALIESTTPEV